ncbi:MAG TPA: NUDIX domain-containing protein [Chroococcales cyanobacterium]
MDFSVRTNLLPAPLSLDNHFTASGVVICREHILLVHHKRLDAWVPPGGHIEPGEFPHETVIREVLEETGVNVEIYSPPLPETGDPEAFFLPGPICIQSVLAREKSGPVYHLDIAFICAPVGHSPYGDRLAADQLPIIIRVDEVHDAQWVPFADLGHIKLAKNVLEMVALVREKLAL